MNDENREWLSALADGELQGEALTKGLDRLRSDAQLQASWRAYHLMRDAVSSNLDHAVDIQLHQRVSRALADEPTILSPQRSTRPWLKQAAGLAIAASVAGVAVIGIQHLNGTATSPDATPVVAQKQEYLRIEPNRVAGVQHEKTRKGGESLTPYLVNHTEFSANTGMQGVLPYVRIVGHKAGQ